MLGKHTELIQPKTFASFSCPASQTRKSGVTVTATNLALFLIFRGIHLGCSLAVDVRRIFFLRLRHSLFVLCTVF
jgi:hypothetical protein